MWRKPKPENLQRNRKYFGRLDDYMRTWTEDVGRLRFVMDKIWQMLQSGDTKTLKLTKYFEEPLHKSTPNWLAVSRQTWGNFGRKLKTKNNLFSVSWGSKAEGWRLL